MRDKPGYGKILVVCLLCLTTLGLVVFMAVDFVKAVRKSANIPRECVEAITSSLPTDQLPEHCRVYRE